MKVHVLRRGYPICGFSRDVPAGWPIGHVWTNAEAFDEKSIKRQNKDAERCEDCLDVLDEESKR